MRTFSSRGARLAAPLAFVSVAVACSHTPAATRQPGATTQQSPPAAASTDSAAVRALELAVQTLRRDRSYRFSAVEHVAANAPVTTRVSGVVVRAAGVSYTLTAGHTRTQVVRVHSATYVRKLPGRWAKLHRPSPVTDPTTSLSALLQGLTGVVMVDAHTVNGALPVAAARAAGVPTAGPPAQVRVTLDSAAHVTAVVVRTSTIAAGKTVTVTLETTYSAFDRTRTLRAPV